MGSIAQKRYYKASSQLLVLSSVIVFSGSRLNVLQVALILVPLEILLLT